MSVDLSQFHKVFFEESHEGLDIMESALLDMDVEQIDPETINRIFRAAHSIKGGSGTFGFTAIAEFTHVVETLLDLIRSDQFVMQPEHINLFLQSVDCLRTMIQELEQGLACDTTLASELNARFTALLQSQGEADVAISALPSAPGGEPSAKNSPDESAQTIWHIYFKPSAEILRTGNDPVRMFRELAELGDMSVSAHLDQLPVLSSLDPEACFLAWDIELRGDISKPQIEEIFEWVADESELQVSQRMDPPSSIQEIPAVHPVEGSAPSQPADSAAQPENHATARADITVTQEAASAIKDSSSQQKAGKKDLKSESASIRVGTDKIDSLINMVGELVITQSMLNELGKNFDVKSLPKLLEGLAQLSLHTRELQESVMRIRMLPISFAFSRFPRLVHDMSQTLNKKVELVLLGEQTELDKTVMERIGDPLVHLVRNSLDHGLESPEKRRAAGKAETGKITLNAFHQGGNIVIQIIDDGAGLNEQRILQKAIQNGLVSPDEQLEPAQIHELIFQPGFSTAETVTDISGRGVGMDVVRRNIQELNGTVEVESTPGNGSTFTIRLPLTLAILDGQLIRVGKQVYIFPLVSIVESIESHDQMIHRVSGGCDVLRIRNEYIPIIRLWEVFNIEAEHRKVSEGLLVIVEGDNIKVAVLVDDLLAQQQVVIKNLQDNYKAVPGVSGATILGDGTVSLILDISGLIKLAGVGKESYRKIAESEGHEH
jgi:two-component system chemotaxis sensor kinase CheA